MDDIVTRLREHAKPKDWHTPKHPMNDWVGRWATDRLCEQAAAEIERLRALCNDLYHDATCSESFCRLCGEGIREWEARRG